MKNLIFFTLVLSFVNLSNGQVTQNEMIGTWKVKKIIQKTAHPELRGVMDGFENATFSFMEHGIFLLKTESKAPAFQMILRMTAGTKWQFHPKKQLIIIGTEEDGYSIMGIYPKMENSIMRFSLEESEMTFEMEKES